MSTFGRNDPCPCGSGKKYKKCCLSKTYTEVGKEDSIRERLVQELIAFLEKNYKHKMEDAHFIFWDEFKPNKYLEGTSFDIAYQNFMEWIVFDYLIDEDKNKTLIDLYMENNRKLSLDEHKVLTMMKNSAISLYEVQEVFPEKGLLLKDLLMGGEYDVREKLATRSLRKSDIFATRLQLVDGSYIMSGAVYPYHLKLKDRILNDIQGEFEDYKMDYPDASMDVFLKNNSEIFNFYWYDIILNPTPIKLHTTSGEPMLFSKALFEIKDREAVINGLPKIKGFERNKDAFTWYDKRDKEGSATILGRAEIRGDKLILESNSQKRLEKGKKLILGALSDAIVHKVDTFQDPMQAMESVKESSLEKPENELPMEIQQQLYTKFMQKHSEKWLKDKIPALNGRTPLQAVKTEEGKRKVIELLKSFENIEEHNRKEGRPFYDMSWMWERIGLERE
ncbi:MAG: SEC-C domain-containing protein [Thermodesulfovibrionales bacterium]|nr:SEC-C domain-containing protein [Thermodesulfovibrionales bacterium]